MPKHNPSTFIDQVISSLDNGLRSSFTQPHCQRHSPSEGMNDPLVNQPVKQKRSAALMRVNHVGEVCAQALYKGQALTSRSAEVREKMREAAEEEIDHLNWCFKRIQELKSHTSYLNPVWFMGSFALGVSAGLAGDKWSLGFLAETEKQVVEHLESHLDRLPEDDLASRAIVFQMSLDEAKHAEMAIENGGEELPMIVKQLMKLSAKVMTTLSERV